MVEPSNPKKARSPRSWRAPVEGTAPANAPDWRRGKPAPGSNWFRRVMRGLALTGLLVVLLAILYSLFFVTPRTPLLIFIATEYESPLPPQAFAQEDADYLVKAFDENAREGWIWTPSYIVRKRPGRPKTPEEEQLPPTGINLVSAQETGTGFLERVKASIAAAKKKAGGPSNNVVLLYLSMQGIVRDGPPALLLPRTAASLNLSAQPSTPDEHLKDRMVPVSDLLDAIADAAKSPKDCKVVVFLDAARSRANWRLLIAEQDFAKELEKVTVPDGIVLINSCKAGEVTALHPKQAGTQFSSDVVEALTDKSSDVSVASLRKRLDSKGQRVFLPPKPTGQAQPSVDDLAIAVRSSVAPPHWESFDDRKALASDAKLWEQFHECFQEDYSLPQFALPREVLRQQLLRLEELHLAGEAYSGEALKLKGKIGDELKLFPEEKKPESSKPPYSLPLAGEQASSTAKDQVANAFIKAALEPPKPGDATGADADKPKPKPAIPDPFAFARQLLARSAVEKADLAESIQCLKIALNEKVLGSESPLWKLAEVRAMVRFSPLQMNLRKEARADSALLRAAVDTRQRAELAAFAGGDARVLPHIQTKCERADRERRVAEDQVFAIGAEGTPFYPPKTLYDECRDTGKGIADAYKLRDRVAANLPYLAQLADAGAPSPTSDSSDTLSELEDALSQLQSELQKLPAAVQDVRPASEKVLAKKVRLERNLENIQKEFDGLSMTAIENNKDEQDWREFLSRVTLRSVPAGPALVKEIGPWLDKARTDLKLKADPAKKDELAQLRDPRALADREFNLRRSLPWLMLVDADLTDRTQFPLEPLADGNAADEKQPQAPYLLARLWRKNWHDYYLWQAERFSYDFLADGDFQSVGLDLRRPLSSANEPEEHYQECAKDLLEVAKRFDSSSETALPDTPDFKTLETALTARWDKDLSPARERAAQLYCEAPKRNQEIKVELPLRLNDDWKERGKFGPWLKEIEGDENSLQPNSLALFRPKNPDLKLAGENQLPHPLLALLRDETLKFDAPLSLDDTSLRFYFRGRNFTRNLDVPGLQKTIREIAWTRGKPDPAPTIEVLPSFQRAQLAILLDCSASMEKKGTARMTKALTALGKVIQRIREIENLDISLTLFGHRKEAWGIERNEDAEKYGWEFETPETLTYAQDFQTVWHSHDGTPSGYDIDKLLETNDNEGRHRRIYGKGYTPLYSCLASLAKDEDFDKVLKPGKLKPDARHLIILSDGEDGIWDENPKSTETIPSAPPSAIHLKPDVAVHVLQLDEPPIKANPEKSKNTTKKKPKSIKEDLRDVGINNVTEYPYIVKEDGESRELDRLVRSISEAAGLYDYTITPSIADPDNPKRFGFTGDGRHFNPTPGTYTLRLINHPLCETQFHVSSGEYLRWKLNKTVPKGGDEHKPKFSFELVPSSQEERLFQQGAKEGVEHKKNDASPGKLSMLAKALPVVRADLPPGASIDQPFLISFRGARQEPFERRPVEYWIEVQPQLPEDQALKAGAQPPARGDVYPYYFGDTASFEANYTYPTLKIVASKWREDVSRATINVWFRYSNPEAHADINLRETGKWKTLFKDDKAPGVEVQVCKLEDNLLRVFERHSSANEAPVLLKVRGSTSGPKLINHSYRVERNQLVIEHKWTFEEVKLEEIQSYTVHAWPLEKWKDTATHFEFKDVEVR
jgi:hypothetical protein